MSAYLVPDGTKTAILKLKGTDRYMVVNLTTGDSFTLHATPEQFKELVERIDGKWVDNTKLAS